MNRTQIDIRTATLDDAPMVGRLMSVFNAQVGVMGLPDGFKKDPAVSQVSTEQAARRMTAMQATETVYLAEIDGEVAGLAALRVVPHLDQDVPYGELTQIYVDPAFRRGGVGDALLEHVERQALQRGCTALYLLTGADNDSAHAFYRSRGFGAHYVGFEKALGVTA